MGEERKKGKIEIKEGEGEEGVRWRCNPRVAAVRWYAVV